MTIEQAAELQAKMILSAQDGNKLDEDYLGVVIIPTCKGLHP
jgi:hypothetical protein